MERLISDFAHNGTDESASPAVSDASHETPARQSSFKRAPPIVMQSSPVEETDFAWAIPEHDPSPHEEDTNTALVHRGGSVIEPVEGSQGQTYS